jgi:mycothiol synthase
MQGVSLRPPRDGDVPRINALFNVVANELHGANDSSEGEVRNWLETPSVDPERDVRVADGPGGELAGYADVYVEEEVDRAWFDLRLHPSHGDERLAAALVDWIEQRVGSGPTTRGWISSLAALPKAVLDGRGYELVRHSYRMVLDLAGEPTEPRWPDGIAVRTMQAGEERRLYEVDDECFADHWEHATVPFEEWKHWLIDREEFDPSLWFVAVDGEEIAGYALCRRHDADPELGWVDNLGVRRPWRRRGLAKALLHHAFAEFRGRGFGRVGLGVDAQSLTGANKLYESVGMRVARSWDVYERPSAR